MGSEDQELSLLFTNDQEIAELNAQYRGKQGPTDVLSFALREADDNSRALELGLLGDVVISLETAKRQAENSGLSLGSEVLRLLIHGLLHLWGYEHEGVSSEVAQQMKKKERELFELVGK